MRFGNAQKFYEIDIPEGWVNSVSEDADVYFSADATVGILSVTAVVAKRGAVYDERRVDEMLKRFVLGQSPQKTEPPIRFDRPPQSGIRVDLRAKDRFVRAWFVWRGRLLHFITYNCHWSHRSIELDGVQALVRDTFRVTREI